MRFRPLFRQLLIGISIRRYLPATGTAGSLRCLVSGKKRAPRPPPRIRLRTRCIESLADQGPDGGPHWPAEGRPIRVDRDYATRLCGERENPPGRERETADACRGNRSLTWASSQMV